MTDNMKSGQTRQQTSRRAVLAASAWGVGSVAVATAAPAYAASATPPEGPTDLAIELLDPSVDPTTWAYITDVPVYSWNSTTVRLQASAPSAMTVTNLGPNTVVNPTGRLYTNMRDYDRDAQSSSVNYTIVDSTMPEVAFSPSGTAAREWDWQYLGEIAPGETVTIPLRYQVGSSIGTRLTAAFSQYRYNLFLSAEVDDQMGDPENNVSEKVGYFPGTHNITSEF